MLIEDRLTLSEQLLDLLQEDPDNLFKTINVEEHPEATFQIVALKRLQGDSWHKLAVEFNVTGGILKLFYRYYLRQFKPRLKEYLKHN